MGLNVIAGPCSAESEEQVMRTAAELKSFGIRTFRAGIWKPRTYPGRFEGVGEAGLPWLVRVQRELGMRVCTEVAGAKHVEACLRNGISMVWIGARTTANPFLVQEIAEALRGTETTVLVKNPVNPDIGLWNGAIERFRRQGLENIAAVHRGFSTFDRIKYRNDPYWNVAVRMRGGNPALPFFCDPSHMGGDRAYVKEISQRALDMGVDGLMIESHCNPAAALSDAAQQLEPAELASVLSSLTVRRGDTDDKDYRRMIGELRGKIDILDESILRLLSERMELSREIGRIKKKNNVAIIQTLRWEEIMDRVTSDPHAGEMDIEFVKRIFNEIHDASVVEQNKILSKK